MPMHPMLGLEVEEQKYFVAGILRGMKEKKLSVLFG